VDVARERERCGAQAFYSCRVTFFHSWKEQDKLD
jgi:hypothetical protein